MKKTVDKRAIVKTMKKGKTELVDPRQVAFLTSYTDPKSPTFANALQSAISAGFSEEYGRNITAQMPEWLSTGLSETLGHHKKVELAEKHLDEVLDMPIITQAMGAFGPIYEKKISFAKKKLKNGKTKLVRVTEKVAVMTYNTSRIKEKTNVAQFTLESLKKEKYGKTLAKVGLNFNFTPERAKYTS